MNDGSIGIFNEEKTTQSSIKMKPDGCCEDNSRMIYDLDELEHQDIYYYARRYINFGIRANRSMNMKMCSKSIFMCHCETSNIWTHLLTTIYFVYHLTLMICRYFRLPL